MAIERVNSNNKLDNIDKIYFNQYNYQALEESKRALELLKQRA